MKPLMMLPFFIIFNTSSLAEDVFLDKFVYSKNPYVLNRFGGVEISPDLEKIVVAKAKQNNNVTVTALVTDRQQGNTVLVGEFIQSCGIVPAQKFIEYVSQETKRLGENPPLFVTIYRFITETRNYYPNSIMTCQLSEKDIPTWRGMMRFKSSVPDAFHEYTLSGGLRYFHAIYNSEMYFYF